MSAPREGFPWGRHTAAVRAGIGTDAEHGAVMPPIHLSTNYTFEDIGRPRQFDYSRSGNPTRTLFAEALAELEGGAGASVTNSGMSAVLLVLQLLNPGDRLVAAHDGYGGTCRAFEALARKGRFQLEWLDLTRPENRAAVFEDPPRMLWIETPSNPLLRITDIGAWTEGLADANTLVVVDNTFLSPVLQRPFDHGADVVVHSTTKYLNGHSDVVGGAVVARDASLADDLAWWCNCLGLSGSAFDSYLQLRGLRTLFARMRIHEENTVHLIDLLRTHPAVDDLFHPSLSEHPGHALAARQQSGFGAMISFTVAGGRSAVETLAAELRAFSLAESLGGVESLICHPATMTHASMDSDARERAGISEGLVRLSVGIEDARDLVDDLGRALNRVEQHHLRPGDSLPVSAIPTPGALGPPEE